jgi:hypothetical protein
MREPERLMIWSSVFFFVGRIFVSFGCIYMDGMFNNEHNSNQNSDLQCPNQDLGCE